MERLLPIFILLLAAGCHAPQPRPLSAPPAPGALPQASVSQQTAAAIAPSRPRTNGVVTLAWDAGGGDTQIVNETTGQRFDVDSVWIATIGGQPVGQNTYRVRNEIGDSESLTVSVPPDTNRLILSYQIQAWRWNGAPGVLQRSTNLVHWQGLRGIAAGDELLVTNTQPSEFFRVMLTP